MRAIILFFQLLAGAGAAAWEPSCQSTDDYGWPRFHNRSQLEGTKWAAYFEKVYGALPSEYPVCAYDFWVLDGGAYAAAGLGGSRPIVPSKDVKEGDLFIGSLLGLQIYHAKWQPVPNNTWVEITHTVYPTELKGMWVWRQRGSGIWYNIGRTLVFPTPADTSKVHAEAIAFLRSGCSVPISSKWPRLESEIFGACAREKGYDSVQFEPQQGQTPMGTFGLTGLTEMVLVNLDGQYTCGSASPSNTTLRSGWNATEQCACTNEPTASSCGLMPKCPMGPFGMGCDPPICKAAASGFPRKRCNEATCKPTKCRV